MLEGQVGTGGQAKMKMTISQYNPQKWSSETTLVFRLGHTCNCANLMALDNLIRTSPGGYFGYKHMNIIKNF